MDISYSTALILLIIVSLMWGSWQQFVKRLGNWPLPAFLIHMFIASTLVVWGGIFLLQKRMIPDGILYELQNTSPGLIALVMLFGAGMAVGIQMNMYVVSKMGLIYSTSIVSSFNIILGTVLSGIIAGVPEDTSFAKLIVGALVLVAATLICQWARRISDRDKGISREMSRQTDKKYLLFLACYLLFFSQSYSIGISLGVRTDLNPDGIAGILAIGLIVIGALIATVLVSGTLLIKNKQLNTLFHPEKKVVYLYALISGICCMGADLLHATAAPVVSVAVAWPITNLSGLWQYFWGIFSGEFKGAERKAKVLLGTGIALFVAGILWITFTRYA